MPVMRELRLDDEADFGLLVACVGNLYSELFGSSAVPDAAAWDGLRQQVAAKQCATVRSRQSRPGRKGRKQPHAQIPNASLTRKSVLEHLQHRTAGEFEPYLYGMFTKP
jgi:hypothetical protein